MALETWTYPDNLNPDFLKPTKLVISETGKRTGTEKELELEEAPEDRPDACQSCSRPWNDDIWCLWHGPVQGKWMCDECAAANRSSNVPVEVTPALFKQFMDERQLRTQLDIVEKAIRNCAEIKGVKGHDAAGAERSVDLNLNFRESRLIYLVVRRALRTRLAENESFPA